MKTRIISAAVALCLFVGVLSLRNVAPGVLYGAFCLLNLLAVWEILHETKLVKNKLLIYGGLLYAVLYPLGYIGVLGRVDTLHINIIYALYLLIVSLANHSTTAPYETASSFCFPLFLSFSFSTLISLIRPKDGSGLLYLILACVFAWGCDTGAYFTGVFFGKHKLCPIISPKKTVEGAVGGIVICTALSILVGIIFNSTSSTHIVNLVKLGIITPFFAVIGMIGDLLASYIKRSCNIKDYGKIMPGHGGVLDRFDSLLLISPVFCVLLELMPIV